MGDKERLLAITPIDGRYADRVEKLAPIVSEYGLIQRRVAVEVAWLNLLGSGVLHDVNPLSDRANDQLEEIVAEFEVEDAIEIKLIESRTNHDVKAVEVWLRETLSGDPELNKYLELIHFGCTSEDINNLAYAMMVRDARQNVLQPGINSILDDLGDKAFDYANLPMLAHTHGQPATPTTLGKEMAVFQERLSRSSGRLGSIAILGKFNGATGNYNAVSVAYPNIDWQAISKQFVESLGFEFNHTTTQIEPHDWLVALCNELGLNNQIMTDLSRDMWAYISMGYFKQQIKEGEVGSSTMPHKVNPIDFENAESNFGSANASLGNLAAKLPISRLQRDLSDSSTQRTIGTAFGHTVIAHSSLKKGLKKVNPDHRKIAEDLDGQWPVLTEAVQTVMRRYGVEGAYDIIKNASRGQEMNREDYLALVDGLDIPLDAKSTLKALTPSTYIGLAPTIARGEV